VPELEQETVLIEKLKQRSLVSQETIDTLVARQSSRYEQAQAQLKGTIYAIQRAERKLVVRDALSGECLKEIELGSGGSSTSGVPSVPSESLEVSLFQSETGAASGLYLWEPADAYGLLVTEASAYLYPPSIFDAETLLRSSHCYSPLGSEFPAFDLFLDENGDYLLVCEREAGTVTVISTQNHQVLACLGVRPQGLKKAMNVIFDSPNLCAYLTDNQSSMLYLLDLESLQIEKIDIGLSGYALGNLALSPDGRHLFLLTLKPNESLLYLDLETHELIRDLPLKGHLFSTGQSKPYDLMTLTPDLRHLLLLTYQDEPDPVSPLITLIDADRGRVTQRYALQDQTLPVLLAFPQTNPLKDCQKSVLELLLEEKIISAQTLASLQVVDLDAPDAPDEGQGAVPTLVPLAAEPIALSPEISLPLIVKVLCDKFYAQTEIELSAQAEALVRLEAAAEEARQFLEGHDAVDIQLSELVEQHALVVYLTRKEVLALIEQYLLERSLSEAHPKQCPQCAALLQSWDCESCGLELESPERKQKKAKSSLTPASHAYSQHIPLADPLRKRLLVLDQNRTLDWVLDADRLAEMSPWQMLWLPNKNLLLVDRDNSQIHELGPSGQVKWTLAQEQPETQLSFPVKATYFSDGNQELFLIVDQGNHRVLALDRQGQIHWQYGVQGEPGSDLGFLDMPFDLQWTANQTALIVDAGNNRVLEVNLNDGQVVRVFGEELGLAGPVFAQRLYNDTTLIVDAGNYRVLELDLEGDLVNECFYFREDLGDAMRIDMPTFVMRGDRQNLILMDEEKVIELLPGKRRLIWSSLLEHLARRIEIASESQEAAEHYSQSFFQYKMPNMDELVERLRKKGQGHELAGLNARLMEKFQELLEVRREIDSQRAERVRVKDFKRTQLMNLPIYCIDRTHHYIAAVNRKGQPLWHFGTDPSHRLQRPGLVTETENSLLIPDTGNHRVLEVEKESQKILWQVGGKLERVLNQPRSAYRTLSGNTLIADQGNRRLVEFNAHGQQVWEFKNLVHIASPYFAAEQGTGTILFADWALQMIKEIRRDGTLIWSYGQSRRVGRGPNQLSSPEYAVRLPAGSTLIADTHNDRVIEVSPHQQILWEYAGSEEQPLSKPCFCKRLANGNTLIAADNFRQMQEVDESGHLCWSFELGNQPLVKD